jgi:hypothetical protein
VGLLFQERFAFFLSLETWADDQPTRAERATRAGAAMVLQPEATVDDLRCMVTRLLDPRLRASMSEIVALRSIFILYMSRQLSLSAGALVTATPANSR